MRNPPYRSLSVRLSPSDARRCIRRPATVAKSPGSSPDTDSLPRTICVWITRSAPVTSNSTAPTSRVPPEDSRFHARRFAPSAGTSPASTRRSFGFDATSRRKAVSRYRSGGVDHLQTGSSVNSPSGCRCKRRRPMFPRDSVESNRMEAAFGLFATAPGRSASCGSNSCGSTTRFGAVVGRCSWQATNAKLANINRRKRVREVRVTGALLLLAEDHKPLTQAVPPTVEQVRAAVRANRAWPVANGEGLLQQVENRWPLRAWLWL